MSETVYIRAGEVWSASLDPVQGHEQGGYRAVIVVSGNWFNSLSDGLFWIIPVTTTERAFATHVRIVPPEGGFTLPSSAMCEQIRTISNERLRKKRGDISASTLVAIRSIMRELILD